MSIRLRVALWYGALCGLIVLATELFGYGVHTRGHYEDLDRALIANVGHAAAEAVASGAEPHIVEGRGGLEVGLRLYDSDGILQESTPGVRELSPIDPQAVLTDPAGPAFDIVAGLAPSFVEAPVAGAGAFGLLHGDDGQRWRAFVLPIYRDERIVGYVEGITPLERLDASIRTFRAILLAFGLAAVAVGFVASRLVAGSALRPISRMIRTAQAIGGSRDFSRRLASSRHRDELGELAQAFNAMLASLEASYRAQQRFVADASHELRAPLTAIQANLELLERQPEMAAAERDEAVREASREAHRLTRLVADLLGLARADAGLSLARQRVELEQIVLASVREARHMADQVTVEIEKLEPAALTGDPDRLKQLLLILLDNAIKYTPPGGRVSVSLRRDGANAELTVRDTGVGIPAEALPHVFERFYRADPARSRDPGGTGLGLPIAQWIVEQHGGRITLDSEPGKGTTVAVLLPGFPA